MSRPGSPSPGRKKGGLKGDVWSSWTEDERRARVREHSEALHALTKLDYKTADDKRQALVVFGRIGLAASFSKRHALYIRRWRDANPGRRVDLRECYHNVVKDFLQGRWGDINLDAMTHRANMYVDDPAAALAQIRKRSGGKQYGLPEIVAWVSEHLLDKMTDIRMDEVPNGEALSMLVWAKGNQADFRSMYDSKRMPSRTQLDRTVGAGDSGKTTDELITALLAVGRGQVELPAPPVETNGRSDMENDDAEEVRSLG